MAKKSIKKPVKKTNRKPTKKKSTKKVAKRSVKKKAKKKIAKKPSIKPIRKRIHKGVLVFTTSKNLKTPPSIPKQVEQPAIDFTSTVASAPEIFQAIIKPPNTNKGGGA